MNSRGIKYHCIALMTLLACLFYGCSQPYTYWDKNWVYNGSETELKNQVITVESKPEASLKVDGEFVGKTPVNITLPYAVKKINLAQYQYEETGKERKILDRKTKYEEIVQETPHIFQFQTSGYHDYFMSVTAPYDEKKRIKVELERSGVINDIECILEIEARKEYFQDIERIITEHAFEKTIKKDPEKPTQIGDQNIYRQTFELFVKDSIAFDALVTALLTEAKRKAFVFNVLNAKTEATFSTNILESWIVHAVSGRVRPGSELYHIHGNESKKIENIDSDGTFAFPVRLLPNEQYVYLISIYKDILVVYKRINVYDRKEEELTKAKFMDALKISEDDLKKLIHSDLKKEQSFSEPKKDSIQSNRNDFSLTASDGMECRLLTILKKHPDLENFPIVIDDIRDDAVVIAGANLAEWMKNAKSGRKESSYFNKKYEAIELVKSISGKENVDFVLLTDTSFAEVIKIRDRNIQSACEGK